MQLIQGLVFLQVSSSSPFFLHCCHKIEVFIDWYFWTLWPSCSKSEYVRCLHFAREDTIYVATNNGYLYHAKLSDVGDVKWTELVRVSEAVPIVCMDLLSKSLSNLPNHNEDWVSIGDGKGHVMVVSVICDDDHTPKVGVTFSWSAGLQRQLLGTYWCKSLGSR